MWMRLQPLATRELPPDTAVAASGGGRESGDGTEFRVHFEAAAVEMHNALNTCRHVAINLGAKANTVKEMQTTLEAYPLYALLDPAKRPRVEGGEGSPRHGSGSASGSQEKAPMQAASEVGYIMP